ncbi:hypothetical protein J6590_082305 [Homalodisca vitripennis]|nr:hypothetical protein J6590_082305 [Homalodisca vitripennis]
MTGTNRRHISPKSLLLLVCGLVYSVCSPTLLPFNGKDEESVTVPLRSGWVQTDDISHRSHSSYSFVVLFIPPVLPYCYRSMDGYKQTPYLTQVSPPTRFWSYFFRLFSTLLPFNGKVNMGTNKRHISPKSLLLLVFGLISSACSPHCYRSMVNMGTNKRHISPKSLLLLVFGLISSACSPHCYRSMVNMGTNKRHISPKSLLLLVFGLISSACSPHCYRSMTVYLTQVSPPTRLWSYLFRWFSTLLPFNGKDEGSLTVPLRGSVRELISELDKFEVLHARLLCQARGVEVSRLSFHSVTRYLDVIATQRMNKIDEAITWPGIYLGSSAAYSCVYSRTWTSQFTSVVITINHEHDDSSLREDCLVNVLPGSGGTYTQSFMNFQRYKPHGVRSGERGGHAKQGQSRPIQLSDTVTFNRTRTELCQ